MKLATRYEVRLPANKLAGEEGFEPSLRGPGPRVLPLDDSPATDVRCHVHDITESKSRRFSELVNDILPLISPQKTAGEGKLIQSLLPNPLLVERLGECPRKAFSVSFTTSPPQYLASLLNQSPTKTKYQPLCRLKYPYQMRIPPRYQMRIPPRIFTDGRGLSSPYNTVTDSANDPASLLTAPCEIATGLEAPLTPPEYLVEVVP